MHSRHHEFHLAAIVGCAFQIITSHLFYLEPVRQQVFFGLSLRGERGLQVAGVTRVSMRDLKRDRLRSFSGLLFGGVGEFTHMRSFVKLSQG
jgi:hypothetical protein